MNNLVSLVRREFAIIIILIVAFVMRIWNLDFQSLWVDELHNMNEADPKISIESMFAYLKCCDQHPPLYFFVERFAFTIFGHTSYVARIISVIAGTASVWAMWFLGKEVLNRSLGTIAAILTCVNYYNLVYSQEARGYIFAFLFAALSFAYFIRLIKSPRPTNAILHAIFSLLLLYSHYYSLFVMVAQAVLGIIFLLSSDKTKRKPLFINFLLSTFIVALGYLPWIPFMIAMSEIKKFWIGDTMTIGFVKSYFYEYFGHSSLIKPFLFPLVLIYLINALLSYRKSVNRGLLNNPLGLSLIIVFAWIFITYLIPYIRSVMVVPMMLTRYTIVVLPAILIILAYGIELLKFKYLKYIVIAAFVVVSMIEILVVKNHYYEVSKTQLREMTEYVVERNQANYPIINQVTSWQQQYYLNFFNSKAEVLTGPKESLVDSILLKSSPKWEYSGFWIVGAHGDGMLSEEKMNTLLQTYSLIKQKNFYGAWAQLYVLNSIQAKGYQAILYDDFEPGEGTLMHDEKSLAIWSGVVHSKPVHLQPGEYYINISARGTKVRRKFPHLNIYVNDVKIADYYLTPDKVDATIRYSNTRSQDLVFKIDFDNDLMVEGDGDRNVFLKYINIETVGE